MRSAGAVLVRSRAMKAYAAVVFSCALIVIACYLFVRRSEIVVPNVSAPGEPVPGLQTIDTLAKSAETLAPPLSENIPRVASAPNLTLVTDVERASIDEVIREIREKLAAAELENARVIYERKGHWATETLIELLPLDSAAIQEAHGFLAGGLEAYSRDSVAYERLQYFARRAIGEFTTRPKPAKFVKIRIPRAREDIPDKVVAKLPPSWAKTYLGEYFADDRKQLLPEHNPQFKLSIGEGPGNVIARDGFFDEEENEDKGWVTKRYSHFLEDLSRVEKDDAASGPK